MGKLTVKDTDSGKMKIQELLERFCAEWNQNDFYPRLYPIHMVPESFAEEVAKAQIDIDVEKSVALPDDVQDADAFVEWARSFSVDSNELFIVPVQIAAVSRRGQVGVFDVEVSIGPSGYVDRFTDIKVITTLTGFSRRKTWIDPTMIEKYNKWIESNRTTHLGDHAEERIKLFQKALQSMIRAKIKDVEGKVAREKMRDSANDRLQGMIDVLKEQGLPLKDLEKEGMVTAWISNSSGKIKLQLKGLECILDTESNMDQQRAFADMVKTLIK